MRPALPSASDRRVVHPRIDDFVNALIDEGRLLQRLGRVLDRQRLAVSAHDVVALEETVHAVDRILLTADEARRRRRAVLELAGAPEDLPLSGLEMVFGDPLPPRLASARRSLRETAMAVRTGATMNHRIISRAGKTDEALLRWMFAVALGQGGPESPGTDAPFRPLDAVPSAVQTAERVAEAQKELVTTNLEVRRELACVVSVGPVGIADRAPAGVVGRHPNRDGRG